MLALLSVWTETDENHEPLVAPSGVALDARGAIFIVNNHHNRVVRFAYP